MKKQQKAVKNRRIKDMGGEKMICTVTFNPSLDYIVSVEDFKLGLTNRTSSELMLPGGKGINVSTVLMNLGIENTALGFMAGFVGDEIVRKLEEMGVRSDFIRIPEGVSKGIKDNSKGAINQMKGFAVQMIDTAKTTLKDGKLSDVFGAEIQGATDMLSKVKLGSKAAGVLAGTNHNLSSGTSLGYIGSASQSMQKEYNFYQNNYSPKALSRFDIYRQSKNLLSQARRV